LVKEGCLPCQKPSWRAWL